MKSNRVAYVTCPRCRAINEHGMTECFLCEMPLAGLRADPPLDSGPRFRLATLMLFIALVAVYLAICRAAPALAAFLLVPGGIALVRVFFLTGRNYGRPPSAWEYVGAFMLTFCVVIVLIFSSAVAFLVTCFALARPMQEAPPPLNGYVVWGLCLGVAIAVPSVIVTLLVRANRRARARDMPPLRRRD